MKKPFLLHSFRLLVMLLSIVPLMSSAADLDIKLNLMNGGPLTSDEVSAGSSVSFGINSAGTRVAADDASAVVVFNNFKFHDNTHGLTPGTVTIKVSGSAKITVGNCAWVVMSPLKMLQAIPHVLLAQKPQATAMMALMQKQLQVIIPA